MNPRTQACLGGTPHRRSRAAGMNEMRNNDLCLRLGSLALGLKFVLLALCVLALPAAAQEVRPDQQKQEQTQTCTDCKGPLDAVGWCEKCKQGSAKGLTTKCRSCLLAIQRDGWCADCRVAERPRCVGGLEKKRSTSDAGFLGLKQA